MAGAKFLVCDPPGPPDMALSLATKLHCVSKIPRTWKITTPFSVFFLFTLPKHGETVSGARWRYSEPLHLTACDLKASDHFEAATTRLLGCFYDSTAGTAQCHNLNRGQMTADILEPWDPELWMQ